MKNVKLEHVNISVRDPDAIAKTLCNLFGWEIRWSGAAMNNGYTVHVGTDRQYLAFYTCNELASNASSSINVNNLNHIAVEVDDLEAIEKTVIDSGLKPFNHGDYAPGQRFYFYLQDNLEVEVVSYV